MAVKELKSLVNQDTDLKFMPNTVQLLSFTSEETIVAKIPCRKEKGPCKLQFTYLTEDGNLSIFISIKHEIPTLDNA